MARRARASLESLHRETANDRFKKSAGAWFWASVIVATFFHFTLIKYFPQLKAADIGITMRELEAVELPPETKLPPPPEEIQRPAMPVVAETELEEDVTIAPTTFDENPVDLLPGPPSAVSGLGDHPVFTPYTVAPELADRRKAAQILDSKFPRLAREAGISGTVIVWAFIDTDGVVRKALVHTSSGYAELDDAGVEAMKEFRFRPALQRDTKVPVWVAIPITFRR